jgi:hypothetical protein
MSYTARDRLRWIAWAAGSCIAPASQAAAQSYPRNLTKDDIDRWMTELSNWGRWGKDDQAGTANLITNAKRKQAAALVKEGISVSMSLDADIAPKGTAPEADQPGRRPRYTWQHLMRSNGATMRGPSGYAVDTIEVNFHGNNTTHLDALSHFIFNGHHQLGRGKERRDAVQRRLRDARGID